MKNYLRLLVLLLALPLLIPAAGCSTKLAEGFTEAEVITEAANVVQLLELGATEELLEMSTVALKEALTEDVMEQVYAALAEAGGFKQLISTKVSGSKDKNSGEEYAVAVVLAEYELKKLVYTLSFTKQLKLAGLYYR